MAFSQAEAAPAGGGAGAEGGGLAGGSVPSPPTLGTSLAVPLVDSSGTWVEADGAVGEPPHHVDARAHPSNNASPSFRGELGGIS